MSTFFQSEQVQDNLKDIFETYKEIAVMSQRLPMMTLDKRLDHIEDCKYLIEKQKTFYTRLSLSASEDEEAADMKQRINAMAKAFGYSDLLECLNKMITVLEQAAKKEIDNA